MWVSQWSFATWKITSRQKSDGSEMRFANLIHPIKKTKSVPIIGPVERDPQDRMKPEYSYCLFCWGLWLIFKFVNVGVLCLKRNCEMAGSYFATGNRSFFACMIRSKTRTHSAVNAHDLVSRRIFNQNLVENLHCIAIRFDRVWPSWAPPGLGSQAGCGGVSKCV